MQTHNETHLGSIGWALLAGGVFLFDTLSEETLSHAFQRGLDNAYSRPFCVGALAVTACHLLDLIPPSVDPYYRLFERDPNETFDTSAV